MTLFASCSYNDDFAHVYLCKNCCTLQSGDARSYFIHSISWPRTCLQQGRLIEHELYISIRSIISIKNNQTNVIWVIYFVSISLKHLTFSTTKIFLFLLFSDIWYVCIFFLIFIFNINEVEKAKTFTDELILQRMNFYWTWIYKTIKQYYVNQEVVRLTFWT